jgi:hypothetical protein
MHGLKECDRGRNEEKDNMHWPCKMLNMKVRRDAFSKNKNNNSPWPLPFISNTFAFT